MRVLISVVVTIVSLLSFPAAAEQRRLLIYCGITMVRPVTELARVFEAREKVAIQVAQGGSEDLYQSAKKSRLGDIYFPGEPSYRDLHLAEGLLGDYRVIGHNQMALFVQKGNPKQVSGQLRELLRKDLVVVIGNAASGSVGHESRRMLDAGCCGDISEGSCQCFGIIAGFAIGESCTQAQLR